MQAFMSARDFAREILSHEDNASNLIDESEHEPRPVSAPNQVFARFHGGPGGNMSYWPATCLALTSTGFRVRFSDGNEDVAWLARKRSSLTYRRGDPQAKQGRA